MLLTKFPFCLQQKGDQYLMQKLSYNIKDEYSHEFNEIGDILSQLKNGRVYEISNAKMDGYFATNVAKLEQKV